jgi:hypothetical protein
MPMPTKAERLERAVKRLVSRYEEAGCRITNTPAFHRDLMSLRMILASDDQPVTF